MMRNLGTFILLSAAAFAQTSTAVQNAGTPATVSVKPASTQTAQGKPSPNGTKATTVSVAPKAKAVSVQAAAKPATPAKPKEAPVQGNTVKPVSADPKAKAASVQVAGKSATAPKANAASVQAAGPKPITSGPKVMPVAKVVPQSGSTKVAAVPSGKLLSQPHPISVKAGNAGTIARGQGKGPHAKPVMATVAGPRVAPSVERTKSAGDNKQASGSDKPAAQEFHTAGRRDPFVSPVVAMGATGSGCSTGKRCLTIDQIALKGVVKSEAGMIAVVTNAVDKAYFLRENDPVFNGYVVKITGDSIIFKETFHDRLGKTLTRDVTKSITRPVA